MSGVIVHEWLAHTGGSENVFEILSDIYPEAERYCLWDDSGGRFNGVRETALARTPLRRSKALALPFMPAAWRHLPASDADWVLCSSHLFSHHARFGGPAREAPKLVYAYTPGRYVWVPELDGRGGSAVARMTSAAVRPLDRRRAQEATSVVGISRFIADRIAATWEVEAGVIYPPVHVEDFLAPPPELDDEEQSIIDALPDGFVLGMSRFVPYKRLEAAIAVGEAVGAPVVLAGAGPDEPRLRELAARSSARVDFVPRPGFRVLRELLRRARVLVFPSIEDFGIVPVEAMASGTPVIANAVGGAAETVVDGVTGALVHDWDDVVELRAAVERADACTAEQCVERAKLFGVDPFASQITEWVETVTSGKRA